MDLAWFLEMACCLGFKRPVGWAQQDLYQQLHWMLVLSTVLYKKTVNGVSHVQSKPSLPSSSHSTFPWSCAFSCIVQPILQAFVLQGQGHGCMFGCCVGCQYSWLAVAGQHGWVLSLHHDTALSSKDQGTSCVHSFDRKRSRASFSACSSVDASSVLGLRAVFLRNTSSMASMTASRLMPV